MFVKVRKAFDTLMDKNARVSLRAHFGVTV
jgi:hypothetical protein